MSLQDAHPKIKDLSVGEHLALRKSRSNFEFQKQKSPREEGFFVYKESDDDLLSHG